MKKPGISLLLLAVLSATVFSQTQTVAITGRVTDPNGKPLTNTLVRLGVGLIYTKTDSNGYYSIGGTVNAIQPAATERGDAFPEPSLVTGRVLFSLPHSGIQVRMSMYDLGGRFIKDIISGKMAQGNYAISAESQNMSSQFYVVRLSIDGVSHVMKFSSVTRTRGNAVSAGSGASMPEARLEKLAAVVDTLHATEPGYSLGITPIQALTGTYNFQLTKTSTWNGDTAAFWGDTSKVKKAAGKLWCTIINRTNGVYADSQIYWAMGDNGAPHRLSDSSTIDFTGSTAGRLYVMIGYKPTAPDYRPQNACWDWEEHTCGGNNYNGNLTRVDAYGFPMTMRLHCNDGYDISRGEDLHVFSQSRQSFFDEYLNEVPYQFTACGVAQAPYRIPNPGALPEFSTGGLYAHYWDAYQASVGITAGPYCGINDPVKSSGLHRHTCELTLAQAQNDRYHYLKAPCNFYSYFLHRRAIARKQYGFPYDDCYGFSSFVSHGNAQWLIIAVGY